MGCVCLTPCLQTRCPHCWPSCCLSTALCPSRVSFLKKAVDQKNRALASLNQVMNVSAALLSGQEGQKPIACTVTANWSCLLLRDTVTISCLLENLALAK